MTGRRLNGAQRARRLAPFAAAMLFGVLLSPLTSGVTEALAAAALLAGLLAAMWLVPSTRLPVWSHAVPFYLVLPVVGLLRHLNGGLTSGYAPLALLPVLWLALHFGRRELMIGLAVLAATFVTPLLLLDGTLPEAADWRLAVLVLLTASVVGFTARDLTVQLRHRAADLDAIGRAARHLPSDERARPAVCAAAREVAQASFVVLLELDRSGRQLVSTAIDGRELAVTIPLGQETSAAVNAFRSGSPYFVADCATDPAVSRRLVEQFGAASVLVQPVLRDGRSVGVLVIGFEQRLRRLAPRLTESVEVIAAEASLAIERADLLARLAAAAHTDGLTGLANRRAWDSALEQERARADERPVVMALLDLDHFKQYNDAHGHQAGDALLQECARRWRGALRRGDTLARWGGEEFAVLLPGCEPADAEVVLERLRAGVPRGCTVSVGAATLALRDTTNDLTAAVDAALYAAKRDGRDRIVWHAPDLVSPPTDLPELRGRRDVAV